MHSTKALYWAGAICIAAVAIAAAILTLRLANVWPSGQIAPSAVAVRGAASPSGSPASTSPPPDRDGGRPNPAGATATVEQKTAAPTAAPAAAAAPIEPAPERPGFDVVRVEPTGETVIAGHASPKAAVELRDEGRVIAEIGADKSGQFVILPPPLAEGSHRLELAARNGGAPAVVSEAVTIEVAAQKPGAPRYASPAPATPAPTASSPQPKVAAATPAPESRRGPNPPIPQLRSPRTVRPRVRADGRGDGGRPTPSEGLRRGERGRAALSQRLVSRRRLGRTGSAMVADDRARNVAGPLHDPRGRDRSLQRRGVGAGRSAVFLSAKSLRDGGIARSSRAGRPDRLRGALDAAGARSHAVAGARRRAACGAVRRDVDERAQSDAAETLPSATPAPPVSSAKHPILRRPQPRRPTSSSRTCEPRPSFAATTCGTWRVTSMATDAFSSDLRRERVADPRSQPDLYRSDLRGSEGAAALSQTGNSVMERYNPLQAPSSAEWLDIDESGAYRLGRELSSSRAHPPSQYKRACNLSRHCRESGWRSSPDPSAQDAQASRGGRRPRPRGRSRRRRGPAPKYRSCPRRLAVIRPERFLLCCAGKTDGRKLAEDVRLIGAICWLRGIIKLSPVINMLARPAHTIFDRRRRRAHRASRDARHSTGYARAIDSLKTSEVLASMRSTAWWETGRGGGAGPAEKVCRRLLVEILGICMRVCGRKTVRDAKDAFAPQSEALAGGKS